MLIVRYVIKTLYEILKTMYDILMIFLCACVLGMREPSLGVNRSHRSENLKIEYHAYLYIKVNLLLVKGL